MTVVLLTYRDQEGRRRHRLTVRTLAGLKVELKRLRLLGYRILAVVREVG